ncbi:MAG: hypothetical protein E2O52_03435 [Gammaproteobacteria bacterium]|nr:MAG: hypothetical protein E2O52_03435 [Gammaproteobacteria bacterium]
MAYMETLKKINDGRQRIRAILGEMRELQAAIEPEQVEDYEFSTPAGPVRLSELFGHHGDLFCTAWHIFDLLPAGTDGWKPQYNY